MLVLRPIGKKALSNLIAYVLLITMTLALSTIIFSWLRFYVSEPEIETCPSGVDLVVKEYNCIWNNTLTLKVKNMGRHSVEGFKVRFDDKPGAVEGFYLAYPDGSSPEGTVLSTGEETDPITYKLNEDACNRAPCPNGNVTLLEIQPIYEGSSCRSLSTQEVFCEFSQ